MLTAAGAAAYYEFHYVPAHRAPGEAAYVLPQSLDVVDTTAELRNVVATIKSGDRVRVLARTPNWAQIRVADGRTGWVEGKNLLDAQTYQKGQGLLKKLQNSVPQAAGHTSAVTSLHLDPGRDGTVLGELPQSVKIDVFGRRLIRRHADETGAPKSAVRDAWYLVRTSSQAGWVLGRLVDLDVPPALAPYAAGVNMVAWQVLKTVTDGGKQVPEYLVADRIGAENVDFNHIRVFTWWVKHHKYVTAYVESNLAGYFPIQVVRPTAANPAQASAAFRLRLVDSGGHRFQKVYGMFDTIVRPLGTVDGWESQAMPEPAAPARRRGARRRRRGHR
ncbi:MAG TPA: SH3 domain-containing protein [Terriglobia bacterium]|nr:SH3 domain-containing protein [Terriglobia bacterium]